MSLDKLMREAAPLKGVYDFDELLLAGGSTKMPQVMKMLQAKFPGKTIKIHDPDLAVAKGAAIFGANMTLRDWSPKVALEAFRDRIREMKVEA
jgi:molecular chaperone DnaK (HSP70)